MPDDIPNVPRHRGKKNRPQDTAWKQQRLPALRPILDARSAIPICISVGVVFIGIGVALYLAARSAKEEVIDYTDCRDGNGEMQSQLVQFGNSSTCRFDVFLTESFEGKVKFMYGLEKYYQNNRHYVMSRNDEQLFGTLDQVGGCDPIDYADGEEKKVRYAPCGYIANSMFNDTFRLFYSANGQLHPVPWSFDGVIHGYERTKKFKNPPHEEGQLCKAFEDANTVRPPAWQRDVCELGTDADPSYTSGDPGVGLEFLDFIVWMQPAALPKFRKMHRVLDRAHPSDTDGLFSKGLPAGNYTLQIKYNYPVSSFHGRKSFIIARDSWFGPRNFFPGVAFLSVGCVLLALSIVFFFFHLYQMRKFN